ncbi:MAG: galactose-1-phosphate uridylyltransferase [Deltaproteobacteria bacterium]|nr:galactose-1-phosphate uridylyltransferase [Deltaproteobacteria bacterium]
MPELRLNLITREWVIIAKERAKRPEEFRITSERRALPQFSETCPFCPGNEGRTPPETYSLRDENGWSVRVTPNKFAALSYKGERKRENGGIKRTLSGVGIHEVIVETPSHNMTTALLPLNQVENILRVYRERFVEAYKDPRVEHVIIFKNQGERAGTSLEHPHSQLVGTPVTPIQVRMRVDEAIRFFDDTGDCLMCKTLKDELQEGTRIIMETEHFVAFIPYAALSPFHTWIFPRRHNPSFAGITDEEINDLARIMKTTLGKVYYGLDNPDFNYTIRSMRPISGNIEFFHWYLSIVPRVYQTSGFEMGSGMYINMALPEASAEFLRSIDVQ